MIPRHPLTEVIELADGLQLVVRITAPYAADVELERMPVGLADVDVVLKRWKVTLNRDHYEVHDWPSDVVFSKRVEEDIMELAKTVAGEWLRGIAHSVDGMPTITSISLRTEPASRHRYRGDADRPFPPFDTLDRIVVLARIHGENRDRVVIEYLTQPLHQTIDHVTYVGGGTDHWEVAPLYNTPGDTE